MGMSTHADDDLPDFDAEASQSEEEKATEALTASRILDSEIAPPDLPSSIPPASCPIAAQ
eukprot:6474108-Amphidinium_carterae.1